MNRSKCSCGKTATHVVRTPIGPAICCEEHANEWNSDLVDPITPEMDAIIAERQTPEGDRRWRAEREEFFKRANTKMFVGDTASSVARALRLIGERRCGFCESPVTEDDGFLEFATLSDGKLGYPDYRGSVIAYLAHADCSPINGWWLKVSGISRESVDGQFGTRDHLKRKGWDPDVIDRALDAILAPAVVYPR